MSPLRGRSPWKERFSVVPASGGGFGRGAHSRTIQQTPLDDSDEEPDFAGNLDDDDDDEDENMKFAMQLGLLSSSAPTSDTQLEGSNDQVQFDNDDGDNSELGNSDGEDHDPVDYAAAGVSAEEGMHGSRNSPDSASRRGRKSYDDAQLDALTAVCDVSRLCDENPHAAVSAAWARLKNVCHVEADAGELFLSFDVDGNGVLDVDEFALLLMQAGVQGCSPKVVAEAMLRCQGNRPQKRGYLEYEDFVGYLFQEEPGHDNNMTSPLSAKTIESNAGSEDDEEPSFAGDDFDNAEDENTHVESGTGSVDDYDDDAEEEVSGGENLELELTFPDLNVTDFSPGNGGDDNGSLSIKQLESDLRVAFGDDLVPGQKVKVEGLHSGSLVVDLVVTGFASKPIASAFASLAKAGEFQLDKGLYGRQPLWRAPNIHADSSSSSSEDENEDGSDNDSHNCDEESEIVVDEEAGEGIEEAIRRQFEAANAAVAAASHDDDNEAVDQEDSEAGLSDEEELLKAEEEALAAEVRVICSRCLFHAPLFDLTHIWCCLFVVLVMPNLHYYRRSMRNQKLSYMRKKSCLRQKKKHLQLRCA
jgi:hypothetical protein